MDKNQVGNIGNPSSNPDVLKNAMEDPIAIYGYRPNKTGNLKKFADKDWSDPEYVADMRSARIQYHIEHDAYAKVVEEMRSNGHTNTEIAKVLVDKRNTQRMAYYVDEDGNIPDMELYNQALEHCPTYQQLRDGWGGKPPKTDEEIIESAAKSSPAFDACCGLYGH